MIGQRHPIRPKTSPIGKKRHRTSMAVALKTSAICRKSGIPFYASSGMYLGDRYLAVMIFRSLKNQQHGVR